MMQNPVYTPTIPAIPASAGGAGIGKRTMAKNAPQKQPAIRERMICSILVQAAFDPHGQVFFGPFRNSNPVRTDGVVNAFPAWHVAPVKGLPSAMSAIGVEHFDGDFGSGHKIIWLRCASKNDLRTQSDLQFLPWQTLQGAQRTSHTCHMPDLHPCSTSMYGRSQHPFHAQVSPNRPWFLGQTAYTRRPVSNRTTREPGPTLR